MEKAVYKILLPLHRHFASWTYHSVSELIVISYSSDIVASTLAQIVVAIRGTQEQRLCAKQSKSQAHTELIYILLNSGVAPASSW